MGEVRIFMYHGLKNMAVGTEYFQVKAPASSSSLRSAMDFRTGRDIDDLYLGRYSD